MSLSAMDLPIELVQEIHNLTESLVEVKEEVAPPRDGRNLLGLCPVFLIVLMVVLRVSWTLYKSFGLIFWMMFMVIILVVYGMKACRQKTRNPPARRGLYAGSRQRPSLAAQEPTIYVSPSNLPPPPKYECMAPPSYEEVVGIHYPNYQIQPITQPLNVALAHSSNNTSPPTAAANSVVVTTVSETAAPPAPAPAPAASEPRRASVTVMR